MNRGTMVTHSTPVSLFGGPMLALLSLVVLFPSACDQHKAEKEAPKPPPGEVWLTRQQVNEAKIAMEPVAQHDVGNAIVTSGKVTFNDIHVSHVFSPVTGRVTKLLAEPGQKLKKGAPLCTIESPDVASAFSDLSKAQADLLAGEHDFKRQKELFEAHAGSQKDYEASQDAFGKARAELERAQQKARLLRNGSVDRSTQEYTLRALIDGEVISRNINPGTEVQGQYSGGQAIELFTIGDIDDVWVMADVFEMDIAQIKVGATASVSVVAYPNRFFPGHVDWVSEALDPTSHTAKVRCSIQNTEHELKPEMYATVSISSAERKALAILRSAILRLGDQDVVFLQTGTTPDGQLRFERRPVAVNEDEGGTYIPVTHGLAEGEKVVTSGASLLSGKL